jgi:hypothetical protein
MDGQLVDIHYDRAVNTRIMKYECRITWINDASRSPSTSTLPTS